MIIQCPETENSTSTFTFTSLPSIRSWTHFSEDYVTITTIKLPPSEWPLTPRLRGSKFKFNLPHRISGQSDTLDHSLLLETFSSLVLRKSQSPGFLPSFDKAICSPQTPSTAYGYCLEMIQWLRAGLSWRPTHLPKTLLGHCKFMLMVSWGLHCGSQTEPLHTATPCGLSASLGTETEF